MPLLSFLRVFGRILRTSVGIFLVGVLVQALVPSVAALGEAPWVVDVPQPGSMALVENKLPVGVWVEEGEWAGVRRVADDLRSDFERVTGVRASAVQAGQWPKTLVAIGTVGRSAWVEQLAASGKISLDTLRGRWEANLITVVEAPWPGVERALVIIGSDKRGAIYGTYTLAEQLGVSPWYYWADVPVRSREAAYALPGQHGEPEPRVKYRGIFLNDEAPALTGWARAKFGGMNQQFYTRLFELLLRLKANYLWPAMWANAFNEDDPLNPQLADEYGIVMGTSHHEPMLRAHQEWKTHGRGAWDYAHNGEVLRQFWREGIRRNRAYESIITLGMRGDGDEPMSESENVALLERIVADQRQILKEEMGTVEQVPQLWALYKEVQGYYERGMRVPDDVTLLWCDDNWGNIRRLPTPEEENRKGGAGVYYHFDYVGGPRSYKWLNTVPLSKIWEQMNHALERKADRIWIVNVGDLKLLEFPTEYFLNLARRPERWPYEKIDDYVRAWAQRDFAGHETENLVELAKGYVRLNGYRKPEMMAPETLSLVNYQEADRLVGEYWSWVKQAEAVRGRLPQSYHPAFFQFIEFPTRASAQVWALLTASARTQLYARQGRTSTNDWANEVERLFAEDAAWTRAYNEDLLQGKWRHIADQTHLGYVIWQQPPRNVMPPLQRVQVPAVAEVGFAVEGSPHAWPTDDIGQAAPTLPPIDRINDQKPWVEFFRRGSQPARVRLQALDSWLQLSETSLELTAEDRRVRVAVDWTQAPSDVAIGRIQVDGDGLGRRVIRVPVDGRLPVPDALGGAVEGDRVVVMEANAFVEAVPPPGGSWRVLPDFGRHGTGVTVWPVTLPSAEPATPQGALRYRFFSRSQGSAKISLILAPSLDFQPGKLRLGVSLDGGAIEVLEVQPKNERAWEKAVADAAQILTVSRTLASPGWHDLTVWAIDPGPVLLRVEVDLGGRRPSYLGPPSSKRFEGQRPNPLSP